MSAQPPFNSSEFRGTRWFQVRGTSTGLYVDRFVELHRNRAGIITLGCPCLTKANVPWSTEKPMSELLTRAEMIDRCAGSNQHPATMLMFGDHRPLQQYYACPNSMPLLW